jgi:diacylglycerol O-acyltransferase
MPDRLTGGDAFLLHLEKLAPMHTLKVLVLDSSARGRQVSLADVEDAVRGLLPYWPRAAQRLAWAPLHRGRPFLVDDPDFEITDHLDERWAAAPGDGAAFDEILCELANRRLIMTRPLWTATLIHGLADGRQAVAVAVHHALADGMAAITTFTALTTASKNEPPFSDLSKERGGPRPEPGKARLARKALADSGKLLTGLAPLVRKAWGTRRLATDFRVEHGMPKRATGAERNSLSRRFDTERVCATSSHPLSDFKAISKETGASINGVLHAVIADALRREIASRGEDVDKSLLASFGIAADEPGTRRLWGNNVSVTFINLHTDVVDPVERLKLVTESAKNGLELRRRIGLGIQPAAMGYASRIAPLVVRHVGKIRNIAHVMTANVPGPKEHRWAGDVEVADFFSLAVLVPPIGLNMTVYSYAGALNIGLLTAPEVHPNPAELLARVDGSLVALCEALGLEPSPRGAVATA